MSDLSHIKKPNVWVLYSPRYGDQPGTGEAEIFLGAHAEVHGGVLMIRKYGEGTEDLVVAISPWAWEEYRPTTETETT